jgi:ABC-type oligopeptide transport system substrate-binding subunit
VCVGALAGGSALAAGEEIVVETAPLTPTNPMQWIDYSVATTQAAWLLNAATCLKLLDYDEETGVLGPEAATAMPSISTDGMTYTFTVRSGQWLYGNPSETVTAESFKRSIERATSPAMAASISSTPPARSVVSGIVGAPDFFNGTAPSISGVQASGDVLTIQLTAPDLTFKDRIAMPYFCATRSDAPAGFVGGIPPQSGGPYFVISAYAGGVQPNLEHTIVLSRNPSYTGSRIQNLGSIRFVQFGHVETEDYVAAPPVGYTAPAGYSVIPNITTGIHYFALNTSRAPFNDVMKRRAAAYALDRTALSATLGWQATDEFISPLLPGFADSDVYPLGGNSSTASSILAGDTPQVTLCHPTGPRGAVALQAKTMLEAVGFQVTEIAPSGYFSYIANPNNCDLAMVQQQPDIPDQSQLLRPLFYGGSPGNYSFFNDAGYNARFDAADAESDDSARLADYRQLNAELSDQAVAIPIGYATRLDAFAPRIGCRVYSSVLFGYAVNRLCINVVDTAPAGGTVSTGGDATPTAPLQTSVTVPSGGTVTITQGIADEDQQPSFSLLEQQLDIIAPTQTATNPLVLTFEIDGQTLANVGLTIGDVVVFRDGAPIPDCTNPGGTSADPDPCIASRSTDAQGDGVIVVRSSHASTWNFGGGRVRGPFQPVDPQPTVNTMKAGRTVPLKFSLGGNFGLDVFASGYPQSFGGVCGGSTDAVESTTTNASGLSYDAVTGTYTYSWKTSSSWKGQCRTLVLRFSDGQELRADFRFS